MASNEHEAVFQWPHTEPASVVVTGTFDQWSASHPLTKTPTGFEASVKIPWGQKVLYKFIVDGTWLVHEDQPTEADHDGNVNNVYTPPPLPTEPTVLASEQEQAKETATPVTSVIEEEPKEPAPTPVTAVEEGTKAPEPQLELKPEPVIAAEQAKATETLEPTPIVEEEEPKAPEPAPNPAQSTLPVPVAPRVPIPIVPVNAAENNPPSSPPSAVAQVSEGVKEKGKEPSTHAHNPTTRSPPPPTADGNGSAEKVEEQKQKQKQEQEQVVVPVEPVVKDVVPEPGKVEEPLTAVELEPVVSTPEIPQPKEKEAVVEPATEPAAVPLPLSGAATPTPAPVEEKPEPVVPGPEEPKPEKLLPVPETPLPAVPVEAASVAPPSSVADKKEGANGTAPEEKPASVEPKGEVTPLTPTSSVPSTLTKKTPFPSSAESPGSSPSSTAASRKKRTSFFGKLKSVFGHDKEDRK